MNRPIGHLFIVALLMFAVLVGFTSWWTIVRADELDKSPLNSRALVRSLKIRRGTIYAADGSVIARSVRGTGGLYRRTYPQGALFGHPIGYSFVGVTQSGFEQAQNGPLMGERSGIETFWDELLGRTPNGDDIRTTLVPSAQRIATQQLAAAGGQGGAAVALDPRDGSVLAMASVPGYDANAVRDPKVYSKLANDTKRRPLINRAVQFGYAPGSTFKVVTLAAGLDSGRFTVNSTVNGDNGQVFSGKPLANDFNQSFGQVDLTTALAKSVNTAFANIGVAVGPRLMREYMERFGFDAKPQLDYSPDMSVSAIVPNPPGHAVPATSRYVDLGRVAMGQGGLEATPLQMAEVAAAIANGGTLMRPHITDRVVGSDGRTISRARAVRQSEVVSSRTAGEVRDMMVAVVSGGTGVRAQIPGVEVAGKTGTAETAISQSINNVWFIGFAPADRPRVAVAVTIQGVPGFGGDSAAPIARSIMEDLLKR